MLRIEREIVINRSIEAVFDFVADGCNEPKYNPHFLRVEQVPAGVIGPGTRFVLCGKMLGRATEVISEITAFERPRRLVSRLIDMPIMRLRNTETFDPVQGGTRMHWLWEVEPRGLCKWMTPLIARRLEQGLDTVFANIKRLLES
jgi:hypothetical protein